MCVRACLYATAASIFVFGGVWLYVYTCVCLFWMVVIQREKKLTVGTAANRKELFGRDEVGDGDDQVG